MEPSSLILFAIRAGVGLGKAARRGYVQGTKDRALTLPLPAFDFEPTLFTARTFFDNQGAEFVEADATLADLHRRARIEPGLVDSEDVARYMARYRELQALRDAETRGASVTLPDGSEVDRDAFVALLTVRQRQREGKETLWLFAGTLIDIGVDWFATVPGALNRDSRHGRVLGAFVDALQKIPFTEAAAQEPGLRPMVGRFFVAALEAVATSAEEFSGDANVQALVRIAAEGLGRDVAKKLEALDGDARAQLRLQEWAGTVFRSLVGSAGRAVLAEPDRFLGLDGFEGAVVKRAGTALLDLALEADDIDLRRAFGREGLDAVLKATLGALADNPALMSVDNRGVEAVLGDLARFLAERETVLSLDLLPDVARLVLERTGERLELIWPDLESRPEKHLLLVAAKTTLGILSAKPPPGARWKVRFTRDDMLAVVEATLDDLAANPAWLAAAAADADANLGAAVEAVLAVLRKRGDERLGRGLAARIVAEAVKAVALRQRFVTEMQGGKPFVARVVDVVVAALFGDAPDEAQWALLRTDFVAMVVRTSLARIAGSRMDAASLQGLTGCVETLVQDAAAGATPDLAKFEACLQGAFA